MWLVVVLVWLLVMAAGTYWYLFGKPSPFSMESVRPPGSLELDQKKRDTVLKQGFSLDKVPENLDAIVIGSGIGGLTAAAVLAKAGKKVLVLEQHDQAGGCCHTYIEKGFEFDVGLHYIGQMHENSLLRIAMDQITEGQMQFVKLEQHFDTITIGSGEERREYTIYSGKTEMEAHLKKQFPNDTKAIEEFFKFMKLSARKTHYLATLKLIPQWLALFLLKSGIAHLASSIFRHSGYSALELANSLTSNKDLHIIFSYFFYGVPPRDSSSVINALLLHHYKRGAYYPRGGGSEIPFHIIPVIQKSGGNVLVRAHVSRVLVDKDGAACGVAVRKGQEEVEVKAPVVISNCGIFNTLRKFLPPEIHTKPEVQDRLNMMKHGKGSFLVFSEKMLKMKDPGFGCKSCMTILAMVNYEWFEEWKDMTVRKRGDDYMEYKMRFANKLFDWACLHFPKLRDKLVFQDVATPLTNVHYLGAQRGAMYSSEHNLDRFHAEAIARNRCSTPVKNLYISGQDVFSCGIAGALHGGLLCASTVLDHIVYIDLLLLKMKLKRKKAKEMAKQSKKQK
uniref:Amine oxidase domain-containing protein n=1 Tax=Denticeps clupeoides TaxID=299321 RepID=A0AAY4CLC5_9TELE